MAIHYTFINLYNTLNFHESSLTSIAYFWIESYLVYTIPFSYLTIIDDLNKSSGHLFFWALRTITIWIPSSNL